MKDIQKYGTLLSLYLAQSIPMSFFSTVVPVIMRMENYSLESIGYLQLVKLPWIVKFLWAPMVDKHGQKKSHYKKWVIFSEIFYAVIIISIGFFDLSTNFVFIIVLMLIAFTASATQDIATDAFAIRILKPKQRSIGNSMQSSGSFLGTLFGSGVLLIVYSYLGWKYLLLCLSLFVLFAIVPLLLYKEKNEQDRKHIQPVSMKDIFLFFKIPQIGRRIILLAIFYAGIIGILTMLKPFLVDLNYSVKRIGFMAGIYGTSFGAISALLGGLLIKRIGNKQSLLIFSVYNLVAASFFYWVSLGNTQTWILFIGIALLWSAYAMSSVIIYTISMNMVRPGREGTDYTLQIVITHLSSLIIAVFSGKVADKIGYDGLFFIETIICLFVILFAQYLYIEPKKLSTVKK